MRECLLECVENELRTKAAAKRVGALAKLKLKAKALFKRCEICNLSPFYCDHSSCCLAYFRNTNYDFCPDCGTDLGLHR